VSQWINLYKSSHERVISCIDLYVSLHAKEQFYVSMDKSIQVFTRKSNSLSQWINLYKSSHERVISCIDLYVSLHAKE